MSELLDEAILLLESEAERCEKHPEIAGIGRGKNVRRWLIEQAIDAARKAAEVKE